MATRARVETHPSAWRRQRCQGVVQAPLRLGRLRQHQLQGAAHLVCKDRPRLDVEDDGEQRALPQRLDDALAHKDAAQEGGQGHLEGAAAHATQVEGWVGDGGQEDQRPEAVALKDVHHPRLTGHGLGVSIPGGERQRAS